MREQVQHFFGHIQKIKSMGQLASGKTVGVESLVWSKMRALIKAYQRTLTFLGILLLLHWASPVIGAVLSAVSDYRYFGCLVVLTGLVMGYIRKKEAYRWNRIAFIGTVILVCAINFPVIQNRNAASTSMDSQSVTPVAMKISVSAGDRFPDSEVVIINDFWIALNQGEGSFTPGFTGKFSDKSHVDIFLTFVGAKKHLVKNGRWTECKNYLQGLKREDFPSEKDLQLLKAKLEASGVNFTGSG